MAYEKKIRRAVRCAAAAVAVGTVAALTLCGIAGVDTTATQVLAAVGLLATVGGVWAVVEVLVAGVDRVVAAIPPARAIAAHAITRAVELQRQEVEDEAGVPRISGGYRR